MRFLGSLPWWWLAGDDQLGGFPMGTKAEELKAEQEQQVARQRRAVVPSPQPPVAVITERTRPPKDSFHRPVPERRTSSR